MTRCPPDLAEISDFENSMDQALHRSIDWPIDWPWTRNDQNATMHSATVPHQWHARAAKFLDKVTADHCTAHLESDCEARDALEYLFWLREGGVALELGGLDGMRSSQTALLVDAIGWRRIIVDADVSQRARRKRQCPNVVGVAAAVCDRASVVHYLHGTAHKGSEINGVAEYMKYEPLRMFHRRVALAFDRAERNWTRVNWEQIPSAETVACSPVADILRLIGHTWIDFAIIDTEGAELNVLQSIDWNAVRFGVLVVETEPLNIRLRKNAWTEYADDGRWPSSSYADAVRDYVINATGRQYKILWHQRGRLLPVCRRRG